MVPPCPCIIPITRAGKFTLSTGRIPHFRNHGSTNRHMLGPLGALTLPEPILVPPGSLLDGAMYAILLKEVVLRLMKRLTRLVDQLASQ